MIKIRLIKKPMCLKKVILTRAHVYIHRQSIHTCIHVCIHVYIHVHTLYCSLINIKTNNIGSRGMISVLYKQLLQVFGMLNEQ